MEGAPDEWLDRAMDARDVRILVELFIEQSRILDVNRREIAELRNDLESIESKHRKELNKIRKEARNERDIILRRIYRLRKKFDELRVHYAVQPSVEDHGLGGWREDTRMVDP